MESKAYYYILAQNYENYDFHAFVGDHLIVHHPADIKFFDTPEEAVDMMQFMRDRCNDSYYFEIKRL